MNTDALRDWAKTHAAELVEAEKEIDAQLKAIETVLEPIIRRRDRLRHRAAWLQGARIKLSELAGACDATPMDEIPF